MNRIINIFFLKKKKCYDILICLKRKNDVYLFDDFKSKINNLQIKKKIIQLIEFLYKLLRVLNQLLSLRD